jgi:hypothetical protein
MATRVPDSTPSCNEAVGDAIAVVGPLHGGPVGKRFPMYYDTAEAGLSRPVVRQSWSTAIFAFWKLWPGTAA